MADCTALDGLSYGMGGSPSWQHGGSPSWQQGSGIGGGAYGHQRSSWQQATDYGSAALESAVLGSAALGSAGASVGELSDIASILGCEVIDGSTHQNSAPQTETRRELAVRETVHHSCLLQLLVCASCSCPLQLSVCARCNYW